MGEVVPYHDALQTFERDRTAHHLRIHGHSEREIAERLNCSIDQVRAGIARMQGDIPADWKKTTVKADLERLDEMWKPHFAKAIEGDVMSTKLCLEMMERRAKLTGLDAPLQSQDVFHQALTADRANSTEKIRKVINLIVNEKKAKDDGPAAP